MTVASNPTPNPAQPIYFDSHGKTLFGWLHDSDRESRSPFALLICKPFGYEATCTHRSIRTLADMACAIGMPTLRFDYVGTGDSAEIDPLADQVSAWSADIDAAITNICRCGTYQRIRAAIHAIADA